MTLKNKTFLTNRSQNSSRVMVQCKTLVNRDAVRRESIDGVEHIIVSSSTLPDDIVMNGGLYPADEIENSFKTLDLTLAPIEHPQINGQFISANDPRAIHDFHAGAFNMNVRRENGRVHVDKCINVAVAMQSDRGKRLLDRIEELETNDNPRPIHTSVGVFVEVEELSEPQTNAAGDEYTWVARGMVFDHDAILLDNVGAAQPHQGVGVAVNKNGDELKVNQYDIERGEWPDGDGKFDRLAALFGNQDGVSFDDIRQNVRQALIDSAIDVEWIEELFTDRVVFWTEESLFEVSYTTGSDGTVEIVGVPVEVERSVTFTPKTNHSEGEAMRELMLKALSDAGITVNADISDADLLAQYSALQANQSDSDDDGATDDNGDLAQVVANAVATATKPLVEQIDGLQAKINSADEAEVTRLAELIGNSDKYPGIDTDTAKTLPVDKLKEMANNCMPAFGLSPTINASTDEAHSAPAAMPE